MKGACSRYFLFDGMRPREYRSTCVEGLCSFRQACRTRLWRESCTPTHSPASFMQASVTNGCASVRGQPDYNFRVGGKFKFALKAPTTLPKGIAKALLSLMRT